VFPGKSKSGHLTTVSKAVAQAKRDAGLLDDVVLYCARHKFATKVMGATGDLSLVMRALGHSSPQTAMICQHPRVFGRFPTQPNLPEKALLGEVVMKAKGEEPLRFCPVD
jgi:hypothetical protein